MNNLWGPVGVVYSLPDQLKYLQVGFLVLPSAEDPGAHSVTARWMHSHHHVELCERAEISQS